MRTLEPIPLWAGQQSIAVLTQRDEQPLTITFTLMGKIELPGYFICISFSCRRKPECPDETQTDMESTFKIHTDWQGYIHNILQAKLNEPY